MKTAAELMPEQFSLLSVSEISSLLDTLEEYQ